MNEATEPKFEVTRIDYTDIGLTVGEREMRQLHAWARNRLNRLQNDGPNPFPDLDRPPAPPYGIAPEAIEPTVQMLTAMRDSQADEPVWPEHGERGATHAALNGFIALFSERLRATPPDTILWQLS